MKETILNWELINPTLRVCWSFSLWWGVKVEFKASHRREGNGGWSWAVAKGLNRYNQKSYVCKVSKFFLRSNQVK